METSCPNLLVPFSLHIEVHCLTPWPSVELTSLMQLPYLHWDTFHNMTSRSRIIEQRREQPYSNPVAPELFSGESIEHKIIWQYLEDSANLPINIRRYLDQYGYPSLRNTATRDNDQVLYKRRFRGSTGKNSKGMSNTRNLLKHHAPTAKDNHTKLARLESRNGKRNGKVLMVDQLWCWIVDRSMFLTLSYPALAPRNILVRVGTPDLLDSENSLSGGII